MVFMFSQSLDDLKKSCFRNQRLFKSQERCLSFDRAPTQLIFKANNSVTLVTDLNRPRILPVAMSWLSCRALDLTEAAWDQ